MENGTTVYSDGPLSEHSSISDRRPTKLSSCRRKAPNMNEDNEQWRSATARYRRATTPIGDNDDASVTESGRAWRLYRAIQRVNCELSLETAFSD